MRKITWICLDGGTTNTRATLMVDGLPQDAVTVAVGVRNTIHATDSPVRNAIRESLDILITRHNLQVAETRVLASGMLGSEAGLINVPHLVAPVSSEQAAAYVHSFFDESVWPQTIEIFPGIKTLPANGDHSLLGHAATADIMRGEESQVWGLRYLMQADDPQIINGRWSLLWPGSHTKLISILADGTIQGSFTTLAGELFAALKSATLLRRSLPDQNPPVYPLDLVQQAAECVLQHGLLRAAFWTRVADLSAKLTESERAVWLSSAVITADIQGLVHHPWIEEQNSQTLYLGGDPVRQQLYQSILKEKFGIPAVCISPSLCENAAAYGVSLLAGLI